MGYRTIKEAHKILVQIDKGTNISEYCLRMLCKNNQITILNVGSKFLINMASLFDFLKIEYKDM